MLQWFSISFEWFVIAVVKEFIYYFTISSNIFNLTLISVDRYIFIHYPLRYLDIMTKKRSVYCICFIWLYVGILDTIFVAISWSGFLRLRTSSLYIASPTFYYSIIVSHFMILSSIILVLNVKIAITACKQSKRIHADGSVQQQNQAMVSNQMKITKMLATVVGLFYVTFVPSVVWGFSYNLNVYIGTAFILLLLMNHWINPVIYLSKNKELRRAYVQVLNI